MALNPNPKLVAAIRRQPEYLRLPLLTTALIESGGRLDAVGDNGQSFGPYQEYSQGRGAGIAPAQRMDPFASTARAAREFQTFYNRGARGASLAYRAQRPADQGSYVQRYNALLPEAQRILGSSGGSLPASPQAPTRPGARSTAGGGLPPGALPAVSRYLDTSARDVMAGRLPTDVAPVLKGLGGGKAGAAAAVTAFKSQGTPADPSSAQVINAAKSHLGTPYSWGGGTPAGPTRGFAQGANTVGYDCSSLVQAAWAKAGVQLPRTTYGQIKVGQGIPSLSQAKPGDLLFPSTGHVQMYLGNGKVIEAPQTGGHVQIVPVRPSYIAIRRPA